MKTFFVILALLFSFSVIQCNQDARDFATEFFKVTYGPDFVLSDYCLNSDFDLEVQRLSDAIDKANAAMFAHQVAAIYNSLNNCLTFMVVYTYDDLLKNVANVGDNFLKFGVQSVIEMKDLILLGRTFAERGRTLGTLFNILFYGRLPQKQQLNFLEAIPSEYLQFASSAVKELISIANSNLSKASSK